jgi:crotonobetainyl-CoA:carnitine CoA-transferase CaiB-like acyl-CoA transferase
MKPLEGISVIELASVLAGPAVGLFLAEQGASVTKVEHFRGGDVTRSWRLPGESKESPVSAYFASVNADKAHVFYDLGHPVDRQKIDGLMADADVVLLNFKPGDDVKFNLTTQFLRDTYPKLIIVSLRGFEGDSGRVAYDVVIQAETGYMSMNGTTESGPLKMPVALMDLLAAHQLKQGVLLGLYQRTKTGLGCVIQHSLEAAGISNLANQASNYLMTGYVAGLHGSLHPNIAPYGDTFTCADGKAVVLAIGSDRQFLKMCGVLGVQQLAEDQNFATNAARVNNRQALTNQLKAAFSLKHSTDLMVAFQQQHIPAGIVRNLKEVLDRPEIQHLIWRTEMEGVQTARVRTSGFTIDYNE